METLCSLCYHANVYRPRAHVLKETLATLMMVVPTVVVQLER